MLGCWKEFEDLSCFAIIFSLLNRMSCWISKGIMFSTTKTEGMWENREFTKLNLRKRNKKSSRRCMRPIFRIMWSRTRRILRDLNFGALSRKQWKHSNPQMTISAIGFYWELTQEFHRGIWQVCWKLFLLTKPNHTREWLHSILEGMMMRIVYRVDEITFRSKLSL